VTKHIDERGNATPHRRIYWSAGSGGSFYTEIEMSNAKKKARKKTEQDLDEALEQSFPASDPPPQSQPTKKIGGDDHKTDDADE
jgi:hypothetical protein